MGSNPVWGTTGPASPWKNCTSDRLPTIGGVKEDGPRPAPEPVREPPRPWVRPRWRDVEVRFSDHSWREAHALAWYKLPQREKSIMTEWWSFWLVQLRWPSGERGWYRYNDSGAIRPRSPKRAEIRVPSIQGLFDKR